jgi:glycosyltransferase involved in cell wall biosynthesis
MTQSAPAQVSIVLGTYNRLSFLKATIASVRASQIDIPYEIIVVDGGSQDGTLDWLTEQRDIVSIVQHNRETVDGKSRRKRSWGYFMNLGFKCAEGRYVCMISDDSVVHPDTLANGVRHFDREIGRGRRLGAVAFCWRSWPEETRYRVGASLGNYRMVNHGLFLREALERVGWIDDARYDFYCADSDLALKIWHAGYEIVECREALLEHFEWADPSTREQNLANLKIDWDKYTARWTGVYYDPAKPIIGDWTFLEDVPVRAADHLFPAHAKVPPPPPPPPISLAARVRRRIKHEYDRLFPAEPPVPEP